MAALPLPRYGLDKLYIFPVYQSRAQYRQATGVEAPPFDATRPPKFWFDPEAAKSPRRNLIYERVIAYSNNGSPLAGIDGKPTMEPMVLTRSEAATVNIPILGDYTNEPGAGEPAVPVPLRVLEAEEELAFGFGGIVTVVNRAYTEDEDTGFTAKDRETLKAIARKLDIAA